MWLTAHKPGSTLPLVGRPDLSGGVMRKPYNIPTFSVPFCNSLFFPTLSGFGVWRIMRTRCRIQLLMRIGLITVRLKPMRFLQSVLTFVCCGLMVGCAHHASAASSDGAASIVLDNHGGYSHGGRRVVLQPDGSYTDTRYTDVVGDQKVEGGFYRFDAEKRQLTLSPRRGDAEHLYRMDYHGQQYWVRKQDQQRVTGRAEAWFRKISLRAETK